MSFLPSSSSSSSTFRRPFFFSFLPSFQIWPLLLLSFLPSSPSFRLPHPRKTPQKTRIGPIPLLPPPCPQLQKSGSSSSSSFSSAHSPWGSTTRKGTNEEEEGEEEENHQQNFFLLPPSFSFLAVNAVTVGLGSSYRNTSGGGIHPQGNTKIL